MCACVLLLQSVVHFYCVFFFCVCVCFSNACVRIFYFASLCFTLYDFCLGCAYVLLCQYMLYFLCMCVHVAVFVFVSEQQLRVKVLFSLLWWCSAIIILFVM